jgi:hypothetical protein
MQVMNDLMQLGHEAAEEFGEDSIESLLDLCVGLTHRGKLGIFDDVFLSTALHIIGHSTKRYRRTLERGAESHYDKHNEHWTYRNAHFFLAKYWLSKGDMARFLDCCRTAVVVDDPPDDVWKMFANATEKLLQEQGYAEEAALITAQRHTYDMPPEAKELLVKEENLDVSTMNDKVAEEGYDNEDEDV